MTGSSVPNRVVVEFAPFRFDPRTGQLTKNGRPVRLHPQPAKVLAVLLERAGEVVSREELQKAVWGEDTHVDFDLGLNSCIRQIRQVLGDDADAPRYVETVPRVGYRFLGHLQVQAEPDLAPELRWMADEESQATASVAERKSARSLAWVLAAVAPVAVTWGLWMRGAPPAGVLPVQRLDVVFPADIEPLPVLDNSFALSPDGRAVALLGVKDGARRLFVRRLESPDTLEIPDSDGAVGAVFSPDSAKIALLVGGSRVIAVSLADGQRNLVASNADLVGGLAWGPAGVVFARDGALWIAGSDGGEARSLTALDSARQEILHAGAAFLPGGRTVLFSSLSAEPGEERIEAVSVDGTARRVVLERASTPVWSPTGHLLFARDGALLATELDMGAARARGVALTVFPQGLVGTWNSGALGLQLAANGTLLFARGDSHVQRLVSVARDGSAFPLDLPRGSYHNPRVSPDGQRVMVGNNLSQIESLNLQRGTRALRITPGPTTGWSTWNQDGTRLVYRRVNSLSWISTDGSDQRGELGQAFVGDYPSAAGPDPDSVLVTRVHPETSGDVVLLSLSGASPHRGLVTSRAYEGGAQLSPDGRWLIYASDETGQFEVYIRPFPELDRQWQVSEGGGSQPRWSADGREVYYRGGQSVKAVSFDGRAAEPVMGKPEVLFRDEYAVGVTATIANYDVTPDGRFLMLRPEAQGGQLRIVLNWTEELKRKLAVDGGR